MGIDRQVAEYAARAIWNGLLESYFNGLLESYFEGLGVSDLEAIDRGLTVLSEVERCYRTYGIAHAVPWVMRQNQRERLSLCANRLVDLLPKLERSTFRATTEVGSCAARGDTPGCTQASWRMGAGAVALDLL